MATKQEIDAIYQENLGRAPDPGAYETYGGDMSPEAVTNEILNSPEYEAKQAGVPFTTQTLDNGKVVNVYGTKDNPGFTQDDPFSFSNKEGDIFAVPEGTAVASGKNYKLVKTANGLDYYVNEGSGGGGVFNTLADLTGIGEIKDIGDAAAKAIPNELKSGIVTIPFIADPFGITQGFWGKEYASEGRASVADITGLKPEEIQMAQDMGIDIASLAAAALGAPYIGAGLKSVKDASKTSEGRQSTQDLLKDVTINYAIAGAMDLMTPAATTTPSAAGDSGYAYDQFSTNPSMLPMSGGGSVAPSGFDPNWMFAGAPSAGGTAAATDITAGLGGAKSGGASFLSSGGWKEDLVLGSLAIEGIGKGFEIYSALNAPSEEDLLAEKQKMDAELARQEFEYKKELLKMQMDFQSEQAALDRAPLPSSPAPSTYSGGVKSPSTYKPYGVY